MSGTAAEAAKAARSLRRDVSDMCFMIRRHPSSRHATPYFGQGPVSSRSSRFDVLVTNAGVPSISVFEGTRMARAREVFEINTFGVIATTQAVLSQFRERGSGVVVDVTSTVVLGQMSLSVVCKASKMPPRTNWFLRPTHHGQRRPWATPRARPRGTSSNCALACVPTPLRKPRRRTGRTA
ncbi:SDR family NAD(P)-dependent oxidoreductase [Streptomyces canus]|uniref:SDR family NAD(P)-dependent oxidoreductase n=1 Tax=Streptomyces canus TaxID=58343 RepID=UPI0032551536